MKPNPASPLAASETNEHKKKAHKGVSTISKSLMRARSMDVCAMHLNMHARTSVHGSMLPFFPNAASELHVPPRGKQTQKASVGQLATEE
jgi:hypothetical protein